ncbi:HelD family protein [Streptomyces sp. NPDC054932]
MASPRRDAVMAEEQEGVDLAYACLERREADGAAVDAAYRVQNEMPAPRSSGEGIDGAQPLAFLRVRTRADESLLIGRQSVWDEDQDLIVISSTAQAAVDWRLATQDDPGEVVLRRRLHYQRRAPRKVIGFFDELVPRGRPAEVVAPSTTDRRTAVGTGGAAVAPREADAAPGEGAEAPSLQKLLLDDLDLPRDGTMRDIVETVQREQLLLMSHRRPGALVIQGGPGTGKTAVGLYRVMWLLDNDHCTADQVLVVGPHQGFLDYAGEVLPALGGGAVTTLTLDRLLGRTGGGATPAEDSPEAEFLKSDDRMADVLRRAVEGRVRTDRSTVDPLLEEDVHGERSSFRFVCKGRTYWADVDSLLAIAREALGESVPFNTRQERFRLRLAGRLLREVPGVTPHDILASKEVSGFVQRVWPRLDAVDVYGKLLGSRGRLEAAAPLLTDEELPFLYTAEAAKAAWTTADRVCLDELEWLLNGADGRRTYGHLVIDEAQDLTPMQARALARRCPSGSFTVLGDLAQATGPHAYRSWREPAALLTGGAPWTVEILTAGFRLPPEVAEFVEPLARMAAPRVPVARSVRPRRDGRTVTVERVESKDLLAAAVARQVGAKTVAQDGRSTAVVVAADEQLTTALRQALDQLPQGASVPVLRPAEAKGIEFDHVVVVEPGVMAAARPVGHRDLYVALTRCTQTLGVVHHAALPPELGEEAQPDPADLAASVPSTISAPEDVSPTMPTTASASASGPAPVPASSAAGFQEFLARAVSDDRGQSVHEQLRYRLLGRLWESGRPEEGAAADIIRSDDSGTHLFEVLRAERPAYVDLREAAARTAEVRYALRRPVDRVFLVCAAAPAEPWAIEAVEGAFGVCVIWWDEQTWCGAGVETAVPGRR